MKYWHKRIWELPRLVKSLILMSFDSIALLAGLWSAFALRFSDVWPSNYLFSNWFLFVVLPILGVFIFDRLGLYKAVVRFMSIHLLKAVALGVFILVLFIYSFSYLLDMINAPRSVPLIFGLAAWMYLSGSRLLIRGYYQWLSNKISSQNDVIIYGAGSIGTQLILSMQASGIFRPIALLDDDKNKIGTNLHGIVIKSPEDLGKLVNQNNVKMVLLAIGNLSSKERARILGQISKFPVKVKTVPSTDEIINGSDFSKLKPISVNEVLGREVVETKPDLLKSIIQGKSICVTGAGGSIGSELARKAVLYDANYIILYETNEYALYEIENELSDLILRQGLKTKVFPIIGSILDENRMLSVLTRFNVNTVLHAAAYKHVPIVEKNVLQGLKNNTIGTWIVANTALKAKTERFILVSTDKAVRPTNVMGATKRFAELCIQSLAQTRNVETIFSMVRFGNVLGSSGSVIPLFEKQIKAGGPVTVTHPEVNRFFMTMSEAASLVFQAGAMARGGEVFVLDMGALVKILDLAKSMIRLSGFQIKDEENPSGDIEISFTGLRPGEKLYEELLIEENVIGTKHSMIMQAVEGAISRNTLISLIEQAKSAIDQQDSELGRAVLKEAVSEYNPSTFNVDLMHSSLRPDSVKLN